MAFKWGVCVFALVALPALGAPAKGEVKLAAPGLKSVQISPDLATFYSDHLAQQLLQNGVRVITASEIQAALGLERQRQLLSCSDQESSCMSELANALGVDGLITGSLGKFGTSYQVNLKILSASDLSPLASFSSRVKGEEPLLDELTRAARLMAVDVLHKLGRAPVAGAEKVAAATPEAVVAKAASPESVATAGPRGKVRVVPWVVVGAGAVALGGGAFFYSQAVQEAAALSARGGSTLTESDARQALADGQRSEVAGWALGVAGVAAVGTGVALLLMGNDQPSVQPAVSLTPTQASVGVVGRFP